MTAQEKAQRAARMLREVSERMKSVSEFMYENNLNLENYPENWNSFDEMGNMLESVFVWSEDDDSVQEMVGDN